MSVCADWRLWAVGSAVFAAATAILAKLGVEGVNSNFATFVRTLMIVPTLLILLLATRQMQNPAALNAKTWLFLTLSALATAASWLCYFRALQLGPAARVAPIDKLSVVMVALAGTLLLGEKLSSGAWLGVGLIAAGAICVAIF